MTAEITELLPTELADELNCYEEQIKKYRRGELDETRMQKYRLHFATYAQRQVPGISSALAVPAYAGIPLTHRDHSSSVTILTGARANDGEFKRKLLLSSPADTLVILMGIKHLRSIARDLVASGRPRETPVAVFHWGSYKGQQTVCGTIDSIADAAEQVEVRASAVIVIGAVVKLRERLQWFECSGKKAQHFCGQRLRRRRKCKCWEISRAKAQRRKESCLRNAVALCTFAPLREISCVPSRRH